MIEAWNDLDTCREQGFDGAGLIPWSEIHHWARVQAFDSDATRMFTRAMRMADADRYEAWQARKRQEQKGR